MIKRELLAKNLGTVEFEGKTLHLYQDAYVNDDNGYIYYTALAVDLNEIAMEEDARNDNEYNVVWDLIVTTEEYAELEDESSACDWDVYTVSKM